MQLFYSADVSAGICTLDAEESRHAVRVLRKREGDEVHVADGKGHLFRCRVVCAEERGCTVESLEEVCSAVGRAELHLMIAPTKNPSRMEWMVEKLVEVGVESICMLQCTHSERTFLKTERLERIALSAMKQSLHTVLPQISAPEPFAQAIERCRSEWQGCQLLMAHCEEGQERFPIGRAMEAGRGAVVLIGPEGDFSEEEIGMAMQAGFCPVSLGEARLRTETAALYAATAFSIINSAAV